MMFDAVHLADRRSLRPVAAVLAGAFATFGGALAADVQLTLNDHRFTPSAVTVPAGERFRIEIVNSDSTPAEFESSDLRAEKIVVPNGRITVMAGPLKPGTYRFFDDYHPDSASGSLIAAEAAAKD